MSSATGAVTGTGVAVGGVAFGRVEGKEKDWGGS